MQALLEAMVSDDLGDNPERITDVDWIRAAGMAGQRHGTAIALWKLCDMGDRRAFRDAYTGTMAEAVKMGIEERAAEAAATVIEWMMNPVCPVCQGRAFDLIPGASKPTLSDHPCQACNGTGRRPRPWRDEEKALHDRIAELQSQAAGAIIRKMREPLPA